MDTAERLRVAHVLAPAAFGGAESVVRGLVAGLCRRGVAVDAVLLLEGQAPHPVERTLSEAGAALVPLRLPARAYRQEARALAQWLARERPDVVHTHGFRADVQGGRAARRAGVPRVSTVHGFTGGGARTRLYEWLEVRALRRFDAVIAVSRPLVSDLSSRGVDPGRIHLLRNAWCGASQALERGPARAELGLPADAFVLGWVGRLGAEKGGDVLVDALAHLRDLPLLACVVGDGPERPALERRARERGVAERVRWCGIRPNAGRLFAAFDVFVSSSHTEGTPIVLLEAMQAGVPIVATAVGGVPDVVGPAESWLVAPRDPRALAAALREVHAGAGEAARRAAAARRRLASEFDPVPWLDAHVRIYREHRGDPRTRYRPAVS